MILTLTEKLLPPATKVKEYEKKDDVGEGMENDSASTRKRDNSEKRKDEKRKDDVKKKRLSTEIPGKKILEGKKEKARKRKTI